MAYPYSPAPTLVFLLCVLAYIVWFVPEVRGWSFRRLFCGGCLFAAAVILLASVYENLLG